MHAWVQPDGTWWVNNAGAVAGVDQVLVVDTCATTVRTRRFLDTLAAQTGGLPVRLAVNTHKHGDHTYGNSQLPESTVLIGHERMRSELAVDPLFDSCPPVWQPVPQWGSTQRRLPDVTVQERATIHLADRTVELLHPGEPAHTTGDLMVWLPADSVLFSGDLVFAGLTPLVVMGAVSGALRALDRIAALSPEHLVPGHGPVLAGEQIGPVLGAHRRYYELVLDTAETARQAGRTPLQAARECDLGEFEGWPDSERLVMNLHRAYADAEGRDVDLAAAMIDAVTYLGHPMITTV